MEKFVTKALDIFEKAILTILIIIMVFGVAYATYLAIATIFHAIESNQLTPHGEHSGSFVQHSLYRMYGSFLTILLGLELISTVKVYFKESIVKLESIFSISILAISRHVIQLHMEEVDPILLIGLSFVMAVLIAGYVAIKRSQFTPSIKS